jgi:hypothetical protein
VPSYIDARNEIYAQLNNVKASLSTLLGYEPLIIYQGVDKDTTPDVNKLWLRASVQTVLEGQATLSGNDLRRRYTTDGLVFIQIFIPRVRSQDYAFGLAVADLVLKAYRGKSTANCVWFRNVRRQELSAETAWNRVNVVGEYQYDEIG